MSLPTTLVGAGVAETNVSPAGSVSTRLPEVSNRLPVLPPVLQRAVMLKTTLLPATYTAPPSLVTFDTDGLDVAVAAPSAGVGAATGAMSVVWKVGSICQVVLLGVMLLGGVTLSWIVSDCPACSALSFSVITRLFPTTCVELTNPVMLATEL